MIKDKNNSDEPITQSTFNMAVASMMRVDAILKNLHDTSIKIGDNDQRIVVKSRLLRDLFVQSYPLMTDEKKKNELKEKVFAYKNSSDGGKVKATRQKELEIDCLILDIESELQKTGIFMPEREDVKGL